MCICIYSTFWPHFKCSLVSHGQWPLYGTVQVSRLDGCISNYRSFTASLVLLLAGPDQSHLGLSPSVHPCTASLLQLHPWHGHPQPYTAAILDIWPFPRALHTLVSPHLFSPLALSSKANTACGGYNWAAAWFPISPCLAGAELEQMGGLLKSQEDYRSLLPLTGADQTRSRYFSQAGPIKFYQLGT